ncbi:OmpA family protein [Streptomyces sp. NBC_01803]|uniref:OmpA family protein n=1 Tax=Streptomyces sp. NBC_01803 TaxID=2975946 RepID=UPI002DDC2F08|nr:OmpA family protein [Streptomyces sp. NBC_01803]WSA45960.1 OmpA family protein [Streptomyces sp. NBC_01803]
MRYLLHQSARAAAVLTTALVAGTFAVPVAAADENDEVEQPPGYEAPAPPDIDPEAAGLMLGDGAALADPRVLDIKFISEDLGGTEQPAENGDDGSGDGADPGGEEPNGGGGGEQREERTSGQHKFTLQTDVLFSEGSDELSEDSQGALLEVAAAINEYQPTQVNIFGFTDDQGSYESGIELSDGRARNTHEALISLIDNPSVIAFNVRGYSEDYPLYDNGTEEGRQRNRRVEISWPTSE